MNVKYNNTIFLIKQVDIAFDKQSNALLKPYNLTHSQFKIIKYLYSRKDISTVQKDIESFLDMSGPTITKILSILEKNGWLIRVASDKDKRQNNIILSEKSMMLEEKFALVAKNLENALTINLTEEELVDLQKLLRKILFKEGGK